MGAISGEIKDQGEPKNQDRELKVPTITLPERHHDVSPMGSVLARLRQLGPDLQEHLALMDKIDWATTSLGAPSKWSQELATQFYLTMLNPVAESLILGPESIAIYNKPSGSLIGDHHPSYFGRSVTTWVEWAPYFSEMQRVMQEAADVGRAVTNENLLMMLPRSGLLEEVFISATVILLPPPLHGFLATSQNTTQQKVRDRRISSLRDFSECWTSTQDLDELWNKITAQLSDRPKQFCFNALYTAAFPTEVGNTSDADDTDAEDVVYNLLHGGERIALETVKTVDLDARSPWTAGFRKAHQTRAPVLVPREDIPEAWQYVAQTSGGFDDICQQAVILPSSSNKSTKVQAFLVLGLSTRRPDQLRFGKRSIQKKRDIAKRTRIERELLQKELNLRKEQADMASKKVDRFATVAEGAEVGFFEQKMSGEIVEANEAYYRISGFQRNPIDVQKAFQSCIFEEDIPTYAAEWTALGEGQSRSFEMRYTNGSYGLASCVPLKDDAGNVTGLTGILTNITALKRIDVTEGRFNRFLTICPEGILIGDPVGKLSFVSDNWFDITGHPRTSLDNIDWLKVIHEDDVEFAVRSWTDLASGKPIDVQLRLRRPYYNTAGDACGPATVRCKGIAEMNESGGVEHMVTTVSDISHLKYAERMQQVRLEEAMEAKRQQENFMDMTSHEIRNPLSAIVHCADSCSDSLWNMSKTISQLKDAKHKRTPDDEDSFSHLVSAIESSLESVETISACASHMKRIVDDLLTLSKLDSHLLQIAPSLTNTTTLLKDIHKMFEVEAQRVGVHFEIQSDVSVEDIGATWCSIDPGRVAQVIVNLVTNAIKFTKSEDRDEKRVTVEMGASRSPPTDLPVDLSLASSLRDSVYDNREDGERGCYLWYVVRDTGIGMTPEEQARIFGRFAQGNIKTYNTYGGSGLGLFISRTLVELQGGEIGVASEKHSGSTFAFYVKTRTEDPPISETLRHDRTPPIKTETGSISRGESQQPIGVLIVEDNEINQRVLKQQLIKHGYAVHSAGNGQEALDFLETTQHWRNKEDNENEQFTSESRHEKAYIDLILLDIEMPILNGLECAKRIRELQKSGDITLQCLPIVAVSANARVEQQNSALDAGMDSRLDPEDRAIGGMGSIKEADMKSGVEHPPKLLILARL